MKQILPLSDLEESLGQSIRSLRLLKNWDRQSLWVVRSNQRCKHPLYI
jgi:hypothetical protein